MTELMSCALLATLAVCAVIDARTRTLPNGLALVLACAAGGCALARGGLTLLARNAAAALAVGAVLFAFELVWRRVRGTAGMGMGDVKYLAALMLADPLRALTTFCGGLAALAVVGAAMRRRSLPLLPFAVGAYVVALASAYLRSPV